MRTYSTAEAAHEMGAPSERWLIEQLRSGRFPGRKLGRHWRMTDEDILDALAVCANDFPRVKQLERVVGLTPTSRKRIGA